MTENGEESSDIKEYFFLHPSLIQQYSVIVTSVPLFERFEVRIKFLSIKNQPGVGSLLAQEVSFWNYRFDPDWR